MMRVLDLFSGIGGFSLGLERTGGFRTVAFCEIDPFCRRVLAQHWPEVPQYDDVRTLSGARLAADGIAVDVICGGFPCQDISNAGKGAGIAEGTRSGLWSEYARLIGDLRPRLVIVENVAALLGRGLERVLGDLAALGFDAEWHCIPDSAVGAPHRRDRIWILAYPSGGDDGVCDSSPGQRSLPELGERHGGQDVADPDSILGRQGRSHHTQEGARGRDPYRGGVVSDVADASSARLPISECRAILNPRRWEEGRAAAERGWWATEPDVGRMAHGVPSRVDRLRSLGNSVVPQVVEAIGRAVLASGVAV